MKRRSNYILAIMLFIGMIAFNWTFNIFTNATNVFREESNFARKNALIDIQFNDEKKTADVINFMTDLERSNLSSAINYNQKIKSAKKESGFENEYVIEVGLVTNPNLIDYPIIKGRNLSKEEILDGKRVIVLSHIFEHLTYKVGDKSFIKLQGDEYEVVGIIKSLRGESYHQFKAYMPYTAKPAKIKLIGEDNLISLIGEWDKVSNYEKLDLEKLDIVESSINGRSPRSVNEHIRFFSRDYQKFIVIFIATIVNVFLSILYWVKCRKKTNYIYKVLGYTKKDICKIIFKESIIVVLLVVVLSNIGYFMIEKILASHISSLTICWSIYMIPANLVIGLLIIGIILLVTVFFLGLNNSKSEKKIYFSKSKLVKGLIVFQIVIMTLNFISAYKFLNEYYLATTMATTMEEESGKKMFFEDSFSISNDVQAINKLKIENLFEKFKENDIEALSYLYSYEIINEDKNPKFREYQNNLQDKKGEVVYIDEMLGEGVFLYLNDEKFNDKIADFKEDTIPVVLGKDYKGYYELNDKIIMENGIIYEVVDFLDEKIFYGENRNSMHLANTVSLNNVIIVPFSNIDDISEISGFYSDREFLENNLIRNIIYKVSSDEEVVLRKILKESKIKLVSKEYALDFYRTIYFDGVIFQLLLAISTFIVALVGLYSYIMIVIEENSKKISIKYSLGYRKLDILKEMLLQILVLFILAYLLTFGIISLQQFGYINSTIVKFMVLNLIMSLSVISGTIYIKLKKFKAIDLLRGE